MLVTMKEILDHASKENYAVAAPNVVTEIDARGYIEVAEELNSPLILDVGYRVHPDIRMFGLILTELAKASKVPVAINLDHGGNKDHIIEALASGFTSVMVDRSSLPFEENVKEVRDIVEVAHRIGVTVEAEIGHVGDATLEGGKDSKLTSVKEAKEFIEQTGVDCLAIAIGTAHGSYPRGFTPYLDIERLIEIKKETNNFPLVLHGSSGTSIEDLKKACANGINKVNIANDLCKAVVRGIKETDLEGQKAYEVWNVAKKSAKDKLREMMLIYGSKDKAWIPENKGLSTKRMTMTEN